MVALVGPNGAGKTTLLNLVAGLIRPSAGSVLRFGEPVRDEPASLGRFAYMAQDSALYPTFTVADLLGFGRRLNPGWDDDLARDRMSRLGIPPHKRVRQLSGGQRAQCALVLAMAKRPDLLLLDEPLASLDPLARHDVMALLMEMVALHGTTIILSSHIIADLVETCDWLVAVNGGRIQLSGEIDELLAGHALVSGPREARALLPDRLPVVTESGHRTPGRPAGPLDHRQLRPGLDGASAVPRRTGPRLPGRAGRDRAARPHRRRPLTVHGRFACSGSSGASTAGSSSPSPPWWRPTAATCCGWAGRPRPRCGRASRERTTAPPSTC